MIAERVRQMTVEEYLEFVENSEDWYEYIDGELCQMTSTKFNHNVITFNLGFRLGILLADSDCQVLGTGQGIQAGETRFLIPDVSVVCGKPHTEADTRILLNPILVAEVTSPSSRDYDRGSKREYYGDVPSLQAYLVIDQHRALVELFTRSETGWHIQSFSNLDEAVPLDALGCSLPLGEIYSGVEFEAETPPTSAEGAQ